MATSEDIIFKIVKVSDKGQIAIPSDIRKALKIKKGEDLLIIRKGDKLLIEKSSTMSKIFTSEFNFILKNAQVTAKKLWNNKEDKIWNSL